MNANDSGVAKWSVLAEHDQPGVGQRLGQAARPGRRSRGRRCATSTGQVTAASRRPRCVGATGRSRTAASASASLPGCSAYWRNSWARTSVSGAVAAHARPRCDAGRRRPRAKTLSPMPASTMRPKRSGSRQASSSRVSGAEREADGVDRPVGGQRLDRRGRSDRRRPRGRGACGAVPWPRRSTPITVAPGVLQQRARPRSLPRCAANEPPQPWTRRTGAGAWPATLPTRAGARTVGPRGGR